MRLFGQGIKGGDNSWHHSAWQDEGAAHSGHCIGGCFQQEDVCGVSEFVTFVGFPNDLLDENFCN